MTPFVRLFTEGRTDEILHFLLNAAMFLPFGFLFRMVSGSTAKTACAGLFLSAAIEFVQLAASLGQCDMADVAANAVGALAGSVIAWQLMKFMQGFMESGKICFAASSGGHLEQVACLAPLLQNHPGFLVTEDTPAGAPGAFLDRYFLRQVNRREPQAVLLCLANTWDSLMILVSEKPEFIICTGALAVLPLCLLGKALGVKLIFIESFAKKDSPTVCGRILYRFADLFIVQWKEMLKVYPDALFLGSIY